MPMARINWLWSWGSVTDGTYSRYSSDPVGSGLRFGCDKDDRTVSRTFHSCGSHINDKPDDIRNGMSALELSLLVLRTTKETYNDYWSEHICQERPYELESYNDRGCSTNSFGSRNHFTQPAWRQAEYE
jgi:hypothetical protein